ncbi:P-loop NTPase fold protein [Collinsella stercoris]|uniref:P-loop NTPase fold protein n=1 Tax=Collinsella stercoris TaxID=147206 RepID=UPI003CD0D702
MDTDVPITKCIDDRLGRVGIARHIADMLIGAPADHSIVFGLSGSWGSGKTSVLNMVGELLSEASCCVPIGCLHPRCATWAAGPRTRCADAPNCSAR